MKRPSLLIGFALAGGLLTGCADDPEPVGAPTETRPERIVSLSPTATEMLFAIGAGDQVVAADSYSNYPDEAPTTKLDGFEPNAEAVIGYEPDLVVAASDPGQLVQSLSAVDVPTLMLPPATSLDDTYSQIEKLGVATGHVGDAAELVSRMRADVDELRARVAEDEPVTYFHELDPNLYTVTGSTYLGELYELAGMTSIADDAPDAAGDYPQLSPEYIVQSDPDLIFYSDGGGAGGVTADDIAERSGWDALTAVREGRVIEVNPDIASRWGPRIVDYLEILVDARSQVVPVG